MIHQEELPMVAIPSMNDTHLEDMIIINKLARAGEDKDFGLAKATFKELVEHTKEHFSGEEAMMREKEFPPYAIHKAEHDRVLKEMQAVAENFYASEEDFLLISAYVDGALAPWVIQHIQTLDTATALYLANN